MTEHRPLTPEELKNLLPLTQALGLQSPESGVRFIDTRLNKEYDVILFRENDRPVLVKKLDPRCRDKAVYDAYFAGREFAVPRIYDSVSLGENVYILMDFADGCDARGCSPEAAQSVGEALAEIQSHYLQAGGPTEAAGRYFARHLARNIGQVTELAPELADVWEPARQRFYQAPHTLVHDDLLPINVLLGAAHPWLLDWDTAGIYPYFLDLARFAMVTDETGEIFLGPEARAAFLDAYYKRMGQNPDFRVSPSQYATDIAISALYQYIHFFDFRQPMEALRKTREYEILARIITHLKGEFR